MNMSEIKNKNQKNGKKRLTLALVALIGSFFMNSAFLRAEDTQQTLDSNDPNVKQAVTRIQFLQNIKDQYAQSQNDYADVVKNVHQAESNLAATENDSMTLKQQLDNLDEQILSTQDMLNSAQNQIQDKENLIKQTEEDVNLKKNAIEAQKQMLLDYLNVMYEQQNNVGNDQINTVKLLLSDDSVGDQLQQMKYFNVLEKTGHDIFDRLETLVKEKEDDEQKLVVEKARLSVLYSQLSDQKTELDAERQGKQKLLDETHGQETIYTQLLDESQKQEDQMRSDILTLRNNLGFIEKKINDLGDKFDPNNYKNLFDANTANVINFINQTKDDNSDFYLNWPVSPSRGIAAYFHDPSYYAAFGVQHQAIDIRENQGTLIQAPADGVVYKVKDNGYGYSYLILAHKGGYMTAYGHVSEFRVKEGEQVKAGQVVALTGGMPGSKGAGTMTTGPHLHFEVLKGGQHVDPLDYLPLSLLPLDGLPDKYLSRITGDQVKISRMGTDGVDPNTVNLTQAMENGAAVGD